MLSLALKLDMTFIKVNSRAACPLLQSIVCILQGCEQNFS